MATEPSALTPIERIHPLQGIWGLLGVEFRIWFPLRAVFLVVASLTVFGVMYAPWSAAPSPSVDPGFGFLFFGFLGAWSAILLISAASLSEGAVLGEINRGTAGWLVAMPIRRASVIVAKFVAAAVAIRGDHRCGRGAAEPDPRRGGEPGRHRIPGGRCCRGHPISHRYVGPIRRSPGSWTLPRDACGDLGDGCVRCCGDDAAGDSSPVSDRGPSDSA